MIDAQQMHDGGLKVMNVNFVVDHVISIVVGLSP